jgi:hypothetical protein
MSTSLCVSLTHTRRCTARLDSFKRRGLNVFMWSQGTRSLHQASYVTIGVVIMNWWSHHCLHRHVAKRCIMKRDSKAHVNPTACTKQLSMQTHGRVLLSTSTSKGCLNGRNSWKKVNNVVRYYEFDDKFDLGGRTSLQVQQHCKTRTIVATPEFAVQGSFKKGNATFENTLKRQQSAVRHLKKRN